MSNYATKREQRKNCKVCKKQKADRNDSALDELAANE